MIKNVFLDLDDTILDFHKAERRAVTQTLRRFGIDATPQIAARYSEINDRQWKLLELGQLTRAEVRTRRYRLLFEELRCDASPEEAAAIYETQLSQGHDFVDGAEALLSRLHGIYQLYLASNGSARVQNGRLKSAGISKYFDGIFLSETIGYHKPDRAFFEFCFHSIPHFRKEESVMIGDSLTSDIKGGNDAGLVTILFRRDSSAPSEAADVRPTYVIRSLDEIDGILSSYA